MRKVERALVQACAGLSDLSLSAIVQLERERYRVEYWCAGRSRTIQYILLWPCS